jgi:YcxB-like protein
VPLVVVDLTRRDLLDFTVRWLTGWRRVWPTFLIVFGLLAAYVTYRHGLPRTPWNWSMLFISAIAGGVGAIVLGALLGVLGVFLHASKMPGLLGRHEYIFTSDGLLEKTDANETLIKWGGALSLLRTQSYVQIEVAPGLAHILPRRAFESADAFERFVNQAAQLVRRTPNKSLERTREG